MTGPIEEVQALDGAVPMDANVAFPVRRMTSNAALAMVNTGISLVAGLVVLPIAYRQLGPTMFGVAALASAAVAYATLFDFGINVALTRAVAAHRAQGDLDGSGPISETTSVLLVLYAVIGVMATALVLVPALPFFHLFDLQGASATAFRQVLLVLAIQGGLTFPASVGNSLLCGVQDFRSVYVVSMVSAIVRACVVVVLLQRGMGVVGFTVVGLATAAGTWLANAVLARRRLPGLHLDLRRVRLADMRARLGDAGSMGVWGLAGYALHSGDHVVLGLVDSPAGVASYDIGARLALYSRALLHGWLDTLLPHTAHLGEKADPEALRQTFLQGTRAIQAVYGFAVAVTIAAGATFLRLWIGPGHGESYRVLVLLMASNLIQAQTVTGHVMLVGVGQVRRFARMMLGYPVLIVAVGLPLASLGPVGMGWAVVVAVVLVEANVVRLVHRAFRPDWGAVFRWCQLPLLVALVAGVGAGALAAILTPDGWWRAVACGAASSLVYVAVFAMVGTTAEERSAIRVRGLRRAG